MKLILGGEVIFEKELDYSTLQSAKERVIKEKAEDNFEITDERVALGLAGEFLVASKVRELGLKVIHVNSSAPVDLIVSELHIPIEVKVARKGYTKNEWNGEERLSECYPFNLDNDFSHLVIIWLVERNEFYIVPTAHLKSGVNRIYPNAKRWQEYRENWKLLTTTRFISET